MIHNWKRFRLALLLVLVVLVLLISLVLVTCNQQKDDPVDDSLSTTTPTTAPTETSPTTLEAAVTNLSRANAFRLTVSMINSTDSFSYENIYNFTFAKQVDGTQVVLCTQSNALTADGQSIESPGDQAYFQGKTAYIQYVHGSPSSATAKWISDIPFTLTSVLADRSGLDFSSGGDSMASAFSVLSPDCILNADGSVSYQLQNMTKEQFFSVYSIFSGEQAAQEMLASIGKSCAFHIQADINPQAYLSQFKLEITNISSGSGHQSITIVFSISQVNGFDHIPTPDYVKNFALEDGTEVICTQNGIAAHFSYQSSATEDGGGLVLTGFGDRNSDAYAVEYYQVPAQIGGTPVALVRSVLNNTVSSVAVERLVIPTGVAIQIQGHYTGDVFETHTENTVLFFTDTKENVASTFYVEGETSGNPEAVYFKAAYYAGQWDYVDGVPTPNN